MLAWDTNLKLMRNFSFQAEAGLQASILQNPIFRFRNFRKKNISLQQNCIISLVEVEQFINPVSREPNFPPPLSPPPSLSPPVPPFPSKKRVRPPPNPVSYRNCIS